MRETDTTTALPRCRSRRAPERPWWRDAVVYQVYIRSFADANGDGIGDLAGVRARLPYLAALGVDALWFNPWYPSPLADAGYDIADYRSIDPAFGTLWEAEQLIAEARALGIRTIVDIVPNHVSNEHPWFRRGARRAGRAPRRASASGSGRAPAQSGELPPNGWQSIFGGSAWTRVADGEWYLHLFAPEQPDLNWEHPEVWAEHEDILRFWFDRGVAGVRIDSAALLVKDPELPEERPDAGPGEHPFTDRDELHDIYRRWRAIADSYDEPRVLVGEVWLPDAERFARYLRPDELHTAFNFDFLACPWEPGPMRASIESALAAHAPVDAPATWVLSNHDVTRPVTRYGRADTGLRVRDQARRDADRPCFAASGARAPPPCSRWRCPARCTSTRAKSSGCRRSENIPPGPPPGSDVAALRRRRSRPRRLPRPDPVVWRDSRPTASARTQRRGSGSTSPTTGRRSRSRHRPTTRRRCSASTARGCASAARRRGASSSELRWLDYGDDVIAFARGDRFLCIVNFGPQPRRTSRRAPTSSSGVPTLVGDAAAAGHHGLARPGRKPGSVRRAESNNPTRDGYANRS